MLRSLQYQYCYADHEIISIIGTLFLSKTGVLFRFNVLGEFNSIVN